MIARLLAWMGFDSISKEEAALALMEREVTFTWRPTVVEPKVKFDQAQTGDPSPARDSSGARTWMLGG